MSEPNGQDVTSWTCVECGRRCLDDGPPTPGCLCDPLPVDRTLAEHRATRKPADLATVEDTPGETGVAVVGDMRSVIAHLFRRAQLVNGSQLVDEETGAVVAESEGMAFDLNELLGEPTVESTEVDKDGNVKNMKVRPHEWPPKGESF